MYLYDTFLMGDTFFITVYYADIYSLPVTVTAAFYFTTFSFIFSFSIRSSFSPSRRSANPNGFTTIPIHVIQIFFQIAEADFHCSKLMFTVKICQNSTKSVKCRVIAYTLSGGQNRYCRRLLRGQQPEPADAHRKALCTSDPASVGMPGAVPVLIELICRTDQGRVHHDLGCILWFLDDAEQRHGHMIFLSLVDHNCLKTAAVEVVEKGNTL